MEGSRATLAVALEMLYSRPFCQFNSSRIWMRFAFDLDNLRKEHWLGVSLETLVEYFYFYSARRGEQFLDFSAPFSFGVCRKLVVAQQIDDNHSLFQLR